MEVDGNSVAEKDDKKQQKLWTILLGIFVLLIIILAISIVIVINNRGDQGGTPEIVDKAYEEYREEIENKISELGEQEDSTAIEEIYKPYLDEIEDGRTKAMLMQDYYFEIMSYDYTQKRKTEVINGMIAADEILETETSGLNVQAAAYFYDDSKVEKEYKTILKKRGYTNED